MPGLFLLPTGRSREFLPSWVVLGLANQCKYVDNFQSQFIAWVELWVWLEDNQRSYTFACVFPDVLHSLMKTYCPLFSPLRCLSASLTLYSDLSLITFLSSISRTSLKIKLYFDCIARSLELTLFLSVPFTGCWRLPRIMKKTKFCSSPNRDNYLS